MKNINKLLACLGMMLACFAVAPSVAYAAVAGHVQFVNGNVQIVGSAGQSRPAQKGDAINEGDTLVSAQQSSAQIKMQDGGFVAVRPDTRLKFDQFVFSGKEDGNEKSFFSLFKGGFRAVTGLIGRINKPNYRITTPAATIGIRGTDHETFMISPDSTLAKVAQPGAYNKVNVGETTLTTDKGTINVLPNQMGFAGGMNQMPQLRPVNTNLFTVAKASEPQAKAEKKEEKKEEKSEAKQEEKVAKSDQEEKKEEAKDGQQTAEGGKAGEDTGAAATSQDEVAPVRETVVVDAKAPSMAGVPATIAPQIVLTDVVAADGTTLNLAAGTATTSTGQQIVPNTPTLAECTLNPALLGCAAVLPPPPPPPTLAECTLNQTLAGCAAILPSLATCTANPATAGCTAVLTPPVAPPVVAQAYVQTDVSFEISVSNRYGGMNDGPMYYYGENSMSAAANIAPLANPPSFQFNYGCIVCGNNSVQLPGASGAVNGNATSFANTGIQFGRWINAPSIAQSSTYAFSLGQNNYGQASSGWAYAPEGYMDTPTTLSAAGTGVFNYVLNGAPAPRNQNGVTGTLNSLSLAANFTTQTVTAALSVTLGGTTWTANSAAMGVGFSGTAAGFSGVLTVNSSNTAVSTSGNLNGAFTGRNYAGAIVDYYIQEWPLAGGLTTTVAGVAAMTRNGGAGNATVVATGVAAPTGKFVVAESSSVMLGNLQTTNTATATAGVLTSFSSNYGVGYTNTTTISCSTCTGQAAADAATGIQFGTWDTGSRTYNYTQPFGGQFHWIKGPGLDPIYLPEVLTGTINYTLDGGTAPTNQSGLAGTLSSASLAVNFTTQTVNIALGLTGVNGHNWVASSTGTPLNWTNYSKNGFWASSGTMMANALNVTMDGATVGNGNISGQLTGSGLNGALFQYQLNAPLAAAVVPSTLAAADTVTVRAPSVTVTGPVVTGGSVSVAFPAGVNATLAPLAATSLNLTLTAGVPTSMTMSGGVAGTVPLTPNPAPMIGSYSGIEPGSGNHVVVDTLGYMITNSGSANGLKYSNFGEWRMRPNVGLFPATATGSLTIGEFAGGMLLTASMPTGNSAVNGLYYGSMTGYAQDSANNTPYGLGGGWVSLNANFTTGALTGAMDGIIVTDKISGVYVGDFNPLALVATVTTNAFAGTVTAGANPAGSTPSPINVPVGTAGITKGHFYGPNANELTGILQLASGTIGAAASFGAANGTSAMLPYESVNGTVALVTATPANVATPYRLVGMSGFDTAALANPAMYFNGGMVVDGGFSNTARVTEVTGAGVTAFDSGFGNYYSPTFNNNSVVLAKNTATASGLGTDSITGISWGRWDGGSINITDRTAGLVTPAALGAGSLHWIAAPSMTAPVALPTTGTYSYVLAGGTVPTDNVGIAGTLNSATLTADFTAQTVNVGVNVGIGGATLNASAVNVPIQQRVMFGAATAGAMTGGSSSLLTATCTGTCGVSPPQAKIGGAFTGATGAGAAMIYGFANNGFIVSGVAAFHR